MVDVERDPLPFALDRPFDCIIYGDVLEHLSDPWFVIRRHAELLSDDGTILICVPNIEHWSFAHRLLRGEWHYDPDGLMDEDASALVQPGDDAGRAWRRWGCRRTTWLRASSTRRAESSPPHVAPALPALGVDPEAYAQRAAPLQYVWRAVKRPRHDHVDRFHMPAPIGGVSHVRVVYPLQAMNTDPAVLTQIAVSRRSSPRRRFTPHFRSASADA